MDLLDKYLQWTDSVADNFPFGTLGLLLLTVGILYGTAMTLSLIQVWVAWYVQPVS